MFPPDVLKEYFKKSYFAVDGLWFMKVEEFEKALEIDESVWGIQPRIQARRVRELLSIRGEGIKPLFSALRLKLEAEDYSYRMDPEKGILEIKECPWIRLLEKSERGHLNEGVICSSEFSAWGREFNVEGFRLDSRGCLEGGALQTAFFIEIRIG
ncbi:MAG: hypothetical protein B6U72_00510 [Candidatus Altiarchaeales archaeon ex4484_2]|nr:MAG: hypothetical protein B6U72_00510 [Candidatus Altiarchaeales archaeon ex4484_2]